MKTKKHTERRENADSQSPDGIRAIERPFSYVFGFRFTNRKHRDFKADVLMMADADFKAFGVSGFVCSGVLRHFEFELFDDQFRPLMSRPISTALCSSACPFILSPAVIYRSGTSARVRVKLPDGFSVGRKRPYAQILIVGVKVFNLDSANAGQPRNQGEAEKSANTKE